VLALALAGDERTMTRRIKPRAADLRLIHEMKAQALVRSLRQGARHWVGRVFIGR
jgi:hypothetical protein